MEEIGLDFYKTLALGSFVVIGWFLRSMHTNFTKFMKDTTDSISTNAGLASKSIKEVNNSINTLNISVEKLILKYDHSYELIKRNEKMIDEGNVENKKIRDRLHKLEGGQSQIMQFIKEES